jgi:hypothetical protein
MPQVAVSNLGQEATILCNRAQRAVSHAGAIHEPLSGRQPSSRRHSALTRSLQMVPECLHASLEFAFRVRDEAPSFTLDLDYFDTVALVRTGSPHGGCDLGVLRLEGPPSSS